MSTSCNFLRHPNLHFISAAVGPGIIGYGYKGLHDRLYSLPLLIRNNGRNLGFQDCNPIQHGRFKSGTERGGSRA